MNGLFSENLSKNPALQAVWFYFVVTTGSNLWL